VIRRLPTLLACAAAVAAALPSSASAGTYVVKACFSNGVNNAWYSFRHTEFADAYFDCRGSSSPGVGVEPGLVARNTGGSGLAVLGAHARMTFDAPPGARIVYLSGGTKQYSAHGWQAGIHDDTANRWLSCCNTLSTWQAFHLNVSSHRIGALVFCADRNGCRRDALYGYSALRDVSVTIYDDNAPNVAITGGSLVASGWRSAVQEVTAAASDGVGIAQMAALIDGVAKHKVDSTCAYTVVVPCPNPTRTLQIDTRTLGDGRHTLSIQVTDSAQNTRTLSRTVAVDNTAPGSPQGLAVTGGDGWKAKNEFRLSWRNPPERHAPVQSAVVAVCPLTRPARDPLGCPRTAYRTATGETPPIRVPGAGQWRTHVWLRDAAGNENPGSAAEAVLRFDDAPPTISIRPQAPDQPAVVRVRARDGLSPLAVREILLRRRRHTSWVSLPVTPDPDGFSAFVNDERFPDGVYELRARAVDQAGNERSTDKRDDGASALLALPLRIKARLAVGRPKRVRARGAGGKRRYRIVLIERPRSNYGQTIPLRGRLTSPGGNPLAGREVQVSERTKVAGAGWRPIATLRTSHTGRFTFKALRGPSRTLRFRFGGADTIRGRTALVRLGVRASTTLQASRGSVVNGEDVTFRGRVRGAPIPATGKLIELQARTRGGWRTFATTRASARTGRWSYAYRFSATRGTVRYRFRARVPKESGFPYESGTSRPVGVRVRGL
jgi:hypothetical protein